MLRGLPASIFLHAAIIGLGYVTWPYMSATTGGDDPIIIPVELVDIGAFDNIAAVREPDPEPEEIAPEPEPEPEEPDPPEPEPEPVDETLPEDEVATASPEPEPEPDVPEETVPDFQEETDEALEKLLEEPEQEDPVRKTADPLDSLLNEAESTFASERQTRKREEPRPQPKPQPVLENKPSPEVRRGAGDQTANTARLESILYSMILPCWDGVLDQPNPDELNVRMQIELDENGNLRGRVRLLEPSREPLGRSPMRVAIERARRAVQKCAPYKLPKQDYAEWQTINVNLGPAFEDTNPR